MRSNSGTIIIHVLKDGVRLPDEQLAVGLQHDAVLVPGGVGLLGVGYVVKLIQGGLEAKTRGVMAMRHGEYEQHGRLLVRSPVGGFMAMAIDGVKQVTKALATLEGKPKTTRPCRRVRNSMHIRAFALGESKNTNAMPRVRNAASGPSSRSPR